MPRQNNRSPFAPSWKDPFGNTFEALVRTAITNIVNAEPEPFRYDADVYPVAVINVAVRDLEEARGQRLECAPVPATPADLMRPQLEFLDAFGDSGEPAMRANCELASLRVQQIEARYPGTRRALIDREVPLSAGGAR